MVPNYSDCQKALQSFFTAHGEKYFSRSECRACEAQYGAQSFLSKNRWFFDKLDYAMET